MIQKKEYINQGVVPTYIEAATNLGISYDPSKIDNNVENDQKVRRAEKDKKAVIELYISSINREILNTNIMLIIILSLK